MTFLARLRDPRWGRPPDGERCAQVLLHVEPLQDRAEAGGLPKKQQLKLWDDLHVTKPLPLNR
jgi:hypothetical protein